MSVFYVIAGFLLLVLGGDFLVKSSVGLSFKFNLSKLIIGMTVVSFATSAPELLVSLQAALDDSAVLALSNVIGSNIANIALVLGLTAFISPIVVDKSFYKLNWPAMLIFSGGLFYFLKNDLILDRIEGSILLIALIIFIIYMIWDAKKSKTTIVDNDEIDDNLQSASYIKIFIWLIIGAIALYYGSEFLVVGAKEIAKALGISDAVIGLSVVAIGTSVPELAASIIAALKGEKAISLGNLIGSNIFNIGSVLGLTAIITPLEIPTKLAHRMIGNDIYWMIGVAAILLPLTLLPTKGKISRYKGLSLFLSYIVFMYLLFSKS